MVYWTMADWKLFGWMVLVMGVVLFIVGFTMWWKQEEPFLLFWSLLFIVPGFTSLLMCHYKNDIGNMETVMKSPQEYSFYLDGEDVDYEEIDLEQYDISYDLKDKKVFLTKK